MVMSTDDGNAWTRARTVPTEDVEPDDVEK